MLRHGGSDWFDLISDFLVCEGVTNRIKGILGTKSFLSKWGGSDLHPGGSLCCRN